MRNEKKPSGRRLKDDNQPGSRPGLQGQVTTATPFAPRWSGPRKALGSA